MTDNDIEQPVIILLATGSAVPEAYDALNALDKRITGAFPDYDVRWAFTAAPLLDKMKNKGFKSVFNRTVPLKTPTELLRDLLNEKINHAVLQPVRIFPDPDLPKLIARFRKAGIHVTDGKSLIFNEKSAAELSAILETLLPDDSMTPALLCAHGSHDAENTTLLEKLAAIVAGIRPNTYAASLTGKPGTERAFTAIQALNPEEIHFIPLFFTKGHHLKEDILGDHSDSWKNQIGSEILSSGPLGDNPAIADMLIARIEAALHSDRCRAGLKRNVFPVSLLCEGRRCIVIGGGKIAARKTSLLLDGGAEVTVISPELNESLQFLLHAGKIKHIARPFEVADIKDSFLTFAATNSRPVNRNVLEACRKEKILCCSVDSDWTASDFVTPAILREEDFVISVSTGGRSCRQSRRLKSNLKHHVRFLENTDLLIIGIDHKTANISELENVKKEIHHVADLFTGLWGVHEFMILSTCNRLEVAGIVSGNDQTLDLLRRLIGTNRNLCIRKGREAFIHLAEVTAGLHAQTVGEKNIVGQLKEALASAIRNGWANSGMQAWVDIALHISKDIRQKTEPLIEKMEIEDICHFYLEERCPGKKETLILGRGVIGNGLLKHRPGATQLNGREPEEIKAHLPIADVVIAATGSNEYILGKEMTPFLKTGAVLIDLAVPRNIDPILPGVIGLSELKEWCRPDNLSHIMEISRPIIEEHLDEYERLING